MLLLVPEAPRESGVQGQGRGGRGAHGGSLPPGSRRGEGAHPALSRAAEAYEEITAPALAARTPALAGDARRGGGSHQVKEHGGNGKTDGRQGKW